MVRYGVDHRVVSHDQLTSESERSLVMSLRGLIPQKRGEIVTSRGDMLPLSGNKNLNLDNTPILLIEKDELLIDVFPRRLEDQYVNVGEGLVGMLEQGIELKRAVFSPEDIARSRLVTNPDVIEGGLKSVGEEVSVEAGKIDVLLRDGANRFLVVELKREATDATIGQVLRLTASLARRENQPSNSLRKMIVCARINSHVELAASSVGIEIRKSPSLFLQEPSRKESLNS
jgi:hypothetical protein